MRWPASGGEGANIGNVANIARVAVPSVEVRSHTSDLEEAPHDKNELLAPEHRGAVTSMVDALEDILKWERASERAMRIAREQPAGAPQSSTSPKDLAASH